MIDRLDGAARVLHSPVPQDVALACDSPWEGNSSKQVTVFKDCDLYRMYYRGSQVDYTPGEMTNRHEFNMVIFDNVRVHKSNLVGEKDKGWYAGATLLDFERPWRIS